MKSRNRELVDALIDSGCLEDEHKIGKSLVETIFECLFAAQFAGRLDKTSITTFCTSIFFSNILSQLGVMTKRLNFKNSCLPKQ